MELCTLNSQFERELIIDKLESLIWTEKWNEAGDFELKVKSTPERRRNLVRGVHLGLDASHRVMKIDTVEKKIDEEAGPVLEIKGPSIEQILDDRVAKDAWANLTASPKWVLTQKPADMARDMFNKICILGQLDPADKIPLASQDNIFPLDTIDEPSYIIRQDFDLMSLYSAIKMVCDPYDLGFRLIRDKNGGHLYFNVYAGSDRTTMQSVLEPVLFSPELDNLKNTTELHSSANYKNVAYVMSPAGYKMVYAPNVNPAEIKGFDRRVLFVNASNVTTETGDAAAISLALTQAGEQALSEHRKFSGMDGELDLVRSKYKYEEDYFLGDLVEMQDEDGSVSNMRVTEQIFVKDKEGERAYPTLLQVAFVNNGSWLDSEFNVEWASTTQHWNELPTQ